eukprot:1886207-Rhodomonas_salina.1
MKFCQPSELTHSETERSGHSSFGAPQTLYIESGGKGPLVTHSSGNHAQALALASKQAGLEAYIVMPCDSPSAR